MTEKGDPANSGQVTYRVTTATSLVLVHRRCLVRVHSFQLFRSSYVWTYIPWSHLREWPFLLVWREYLSFLDFESKFTINLFFSTFLLIWLQNSLLYPPPKNLFYSSPSQNHRYESTRTRQSWYIAHLIHLTLFTTLYEGPWPGPYRFP